METRWVSYSERFKLQRKEESTHDLLCSALKALRANRISLQSRCSRPEADRSPCSCVVVVFISSASASALDPTFPTVRPPFSFMQEIFSDIVLLTRFIEQSASTLVCAAELYPLNGIPDRQTRERPCHIINADTFVFESTRLTSELFVGDTFVQPTTVTWMGEEQMMFSFGVSLSSF